MNPATNFPHLMRHDSESPEGEDSHATSPVDCLPSKASASVIDLTSPIQSSTSMPPVLSTPPVPPTSRIIEENNDDYRFAAARLWSFRSWPKSFIDPISLAAAGFYYTGEIDRVRCFECQLVVSHWTDGDIPMQIHEMRSPECRFISNEHCDNVSSGADPDKVLWSKRRNRYISCPYGLQYQESFDFKEHRFLRNLKSPTAYELSRLGLKDVKKPERLEYASYESRLKSFDTWPAYMAQTSEELADAGFYYTGIHDFTTCYHCGIDIGNWRPEEIPWEEHAILSPRCCYLLTVRGWEYVNKVTGQELYETSAEPPIEITYENPERSNNDNATNEMTLLEKLAFLEKENRALKDARSCKVCTEREATIIFLPCGHVATCQGCSPAFKKCIICRQNIKATSRTFLA